MGPIGIPELIVLPFVAAVIFAVAWPAGRICKRAGFSPWLGLLAFVPVANVILLWFVALTPWPGLAPGQRET